jgi:hypothetical protein
MEHGQDWEVQQPSRFSSTALALAKFNIEHEMEKI